MHKSAIQRWPPSCEACCASRPAREGRSADGLDRQAESDAQFHLRIAQASGNALAQEILTAIGPAFVESNRAVLAVSGPDKQSSGTRGIVHALAAGDPAVAAADMRAHIRRVHTEIRDIQQALNA